MSNVLIIGGHGRVALHLARLLTGRGDTVVSAFRNAGHSEDIAATGATPRVVDIETLAADAAGELVAGHDAVVFAAGAGGGDPERTYAVDRDAAITLIGAAETVGVPRFVMVSYFGAKPDHGVSPEESFFHYAEAKAAADERLRASSLQWTILGPGHLTEGAATGRITVGDEAADGEVSRQDVAAVAAAVLADPATAGRTIRFNTGDTPIEDAV